MLNAVSIYLGGVVINASECDYATCRELGLKCAYCNQAVYLKSGFIRNQKLKNGKEVVQQIPAAFSHYKTGSFIDYDCEQRSYSKTGKDQLKRLEIEHKNQRLKLYNDRLWELYKVARGITWKSVKSYIKKKFGSKYIETICKETRLLWEDEIEYMHKVLDYELQRFMRIDLDKLDEYFANNPKRAEAVNPEKTKQLIELFKKSYNIRLHQGVVAEIADFLTTKTSGYFWEQFVCEAIHKICLFKDYSPIEFKEAFVNPPKDRPHIFTIYIVRNLSTCPWLLAIDAALNKTKKAELFT